MSVKAGGRSSLKLQDQIHSLDYGMEQFVADIDVKVVALPLHRVLHPVFDGQQAEDKEQTVIETLP